MKNKNEHLHTAKINKKDEFYTFISTIEDELKYYNDFLIDKIIYCNCDNYNESNFVKYFVDNFNKLKIKKIISTCYNNNYNEALYFEFDGVNKIIKKMDDNGDFRSIECIEILKQSDIVITNPPFSLFREYVSILNEYDKKYLIIGNINAVTYKEIFKLFLNNKIWLGCTFGNTYFKIPNDYELITNISKKDENDFNNVSVSIRWFTNINYNKKYNILNLNKYFDNTYKKFDNYDVININKIKNIPIDYDDIMGVPITFIDYYDPSKFELLGITDRQNSSGLRTKIYTKEDSIKYHDLNARGVIKENNKYKCVYARLLIRHKK